MAVDVGSVYRIRLELYANEFLSVADNRTMAGHRTSDFLRFGKKTLYLVSLLLLVSAMQCESLGTS